MEELKEQLIRDAQASGICDEGLHRMLDAPDVDALVEYYLANPDWCMERDYPTLDFLREHFPEIEDKGVYVEKTFEGELLNERQVYIFHRCRGTVRVGLNVEEKLIPMIYVGNGCRLKIVGEKTDKRANVTRVPIYLFGRNDIAARDNRYVKFIQFRNKGL